MRHSQEEDDERALSQQALVQARDAIARDAARLAQNKSTVAAMAHGLGLTISAERDSGNALARAVEAQLDIVEEMGRKVQSAPTPVEAQQWQAVQVNAFNDLRVAEEALREFEARRVETVESRKMERFRTLCGVSLGVATTVAGAVISLLGHPIVGVPVAGGGIAFIQQALGKSRDGGKDGKEEGKE